MSDIDTAVVDSLKALDPEWPIREEKQILADMPGEGVGNDRLTVAVLRFKRHLIAANSVI